MCRGRVHTSLWSARWAQGDFDNDEASYGSGCDENNALIRSTYSVDELPYALADELRRQGIEPTCPDAWPIFDQAILTLKGVR